MGKFGVATQADKANPSKLSKNSKRRQRINKRGHPTSKGDKRRPNLVGGEAYRKNHDSVAWGSVDWTERRARAKVAQGVPITDEEMEALARRVVDDGLITPDAETETLIRERMGLPGVEQDDRERRAMMEETSARLLAAGRYAVDESMTEGDVFREWHEARTVARSSSTGLPARPFLADAMRESQWRSRERMIKLHVVGYGPDPVYVNARHVVMVDVAQDPDVAGFGPEEKTHIWMSGAVANPLRVDETVDEVVATLECRVWPPPMPLPLPSDGTPQRKGS